MRNQILFDVGTGEEIKILKTGADTDGSYLEFENVIPANLSGPPSHAHPRQTEHFEVLKGSLRVCVDGVWSTLQVGESAQVLPGTYHTFDNPGQNEMIMRVRLSPALDAEQLYDGLLGLEMHKSKIGALLRLARLMTNVDSWFYLKGPQKLQRAAFHMLARLAAVMGIDYPRAARRSSHVERK